MAAVEIFNPDALGKPQMPYSHIAVAPPGARLIAIAGQVSTRGGRLVGEGDIEAQAAQVYANLGEALQAAGAGWGNVFQLMTFLTRREDIAGFTAWRQRELAKFFPGAFPPNTLLIVSGLASEAFLLEVQAVAAV